MPMLWEFDPNNPLVILRRNRIAKLLTHWRKAKLTYHEIGRRLGVSASRAMQIDWRRLRRRYGHNRADWKY